MSGWKKKTVPGVLLAGIVLWAMTPPVARTGELDEVLSGFDDGGAGPEPAAADPLGEVLSGFDDGDDSPAATKEDTASRDRFAPFGSLSLETSWNFGHDAPEPGQPDYRDLSRLRFTGSLGADMDMGSWRLRASGHAFYDAAWALGDRELYSDTFLDGYESEAEIDDLYLAGSLTPSLDLKVGRQVVVWGKADNLRVTDLLNPLDNRTPGLVDIKYRRLPVTMTKLDYYRGDWNLSGMVLHEVRFDRNPLFNGEFFPGGQPLPPERKPTDFALDSQQYALALNGIFSGWDLSIYQAWVYDARAHLVHSDQGVFLEHNRVAMSGLTTNIAFGNWLLKGEAAWWQGLEYGAVSGDDFDRLDLMLGLEYTGFAETVLSIEIVNRHLMDFDLRLAAGPDFAQEDSLQTAVMLKRDFFNDTLTGKILCIFFGGHGEDGAFERLQLEYDYSDHVTLTGGILLYQDGDLPAFEKIGDSDRIFFTYTYSF